MLTLVLLLDQVTKAAVRGCFKVGEGMPLIEGVVRVLRVQNTGAAFSLGEGGGLFFALMAFVVLGVTCVAVFREELPTTLVVALACVAGGGLGNAVDRILAGSVTDFLATTFMSFPVFNVADIFVTCGVAVGIVSFWLWDARRGQEA